MHTQTSVILSTLALLVVTYLSLTRAEGTWRPQGRFGKRSAPTQSEDGDDYLEMAKKWKPQGRFGKRTQEHDITEGADDEFLLLSKKWKPQGRFGKRAETDIDTDFEEIEKKWKPQGRFGKRATADLLDMAKKWKPQGRFGKRGDSLSTDMDSDSLMTSWMDELVDVDDAYFRAEDRVCILDRETNLYRCLRWKPSATGSLV